MQLVLLLAKLKEHAAADAFRAPRGPLFENLRHAEHARHTADEDVEVARKAVLERRQLHQTRHQLFRVSAALEVDGDLEAGKVGLVTHVRDLAHLAGLDQLRDLVDDGLDRGRVRDFRNLDEVFLFVVLPLGTDLERAAAGGVNRAHLALVENQLAAGREVGRGQGRKNVVLRVFDALDGRAADLAEVEAAEVRGHADRDAGVRGNEDIREGRGQQGRLFHLAVVVVHEIHRVRVDVAEQLGADAVALSLGVSRRGERHIARIDLAEVALGVHERRQKRLVAARQAHHGFVDGGVAVRIELHGLADDIRGFGAVAVQQTHFIHGIEQLAVGRLEAVDLRNGARHDNAHGVGHIVLAQRIRDALVYRRMLFIYFRFIVFLFCHL